jgi:hypothetical protein
MTLSTIFQLYRGVAVSFIGGEENRMKTPHEKVNKISF